MLPERKKKITVLTLALISLVLDMIVVLPLRSLDAILERIQVSYWGWVPAFILPLAAIAGALCWKPWNETLRGVILFLLIISLMFAGFWFIFFFISQLGP